MVAAAPPEQAAGGTPAPPWKIRVETLRLKPARFLLTDETYSPTRLWSVDTLTVEGAQLSTAPGDPPGKLGADMTVRVRPGRFRPVALAVRADPVRLEPLHAEARLTLRDFGLGLVGPALLQAGARAAPTQGLLRADLELAIEEAAAGARQLHASGSVSATDVVVLQPGETSPLAELARLAVHIKRADGLNQTLELRAIEVEGPRISVLRDEAGQVHLPGMLQTAPATGTPAPVAAAPRSGSAPVATPGQRPVVTAILRAVRLPWSLRLDRLTVRNGTGTFEDRAAEPDVKLVLPNIIADVRRVTWPSRRPPMTFTASWGMPGGGWTWVEGNVVLEPLKAQFASSTRDAPIEPYQGYFPFPAQMIGFFSGWSVNEVERNGGELRAASRGTAWSWGMEARDPQTQEAAVRVGGMEIRHIDFAWPNYALVERVTISQPALAVDRDADGINLRELFTARPRPGAEPAAPAAAEPAPGDTPETDGPGILETFVIDLQEIAIEDGFARFIDRTTTPPFSQDLSRLMVTVRDVSNELGRKRTTLTLQALVGGDAALDMRGELSGIGESLRADLVGEIRDYALPTTNPYTDQLTSWIIQRGKLQAKVHYRIEGDQLLADHDVNFKGLDVKRSQGSDQAKQRLGVPLGLAVGILKDSRGDIDFQIPLSGRWTDRDFNWGETMWAAVKQVILKVLAAPFNAIGRMFTGGGDDDADVPFEIHPVVFEAGSAVLGPSTEAQLTRIAEFLRDSPFVKISLAPVATAPDVESLKTQAVTGRIQDLQRERKLPDFAAAVAEYAKERGVAPVAPPPAAPAPAPPGAARALPGLEQQLARLREMEPVPEMRLEELLARRADATRDVLVTREGIAAERVVVRPAEKHLDEKKEGRVEFGIGAE
ncbi:MAG: DUF748 domain-containing protein [Candidatus Rokubacteria bacterium]|nr:DUF748 domain-containing protein [Candidatus Rokubacteria bacterium]